MNRVTFFGRVTKDPKLFQSDKKMSYSRPVIAVNRNKEGVDFIQCIIFGKTAEVFCEYVKKGHLVLVVGHVQTGPYEKDGQTHYSQNLVIDSFEFADSHWKEKVNENSAVTERKTVSEPAPKENKNEEISEDEVVPTVGSDDTDDTDDLASILEQFREE